MVVVHPSEFCIHHSPDSCVQSGPCTMPDCNWAALYFHAGFPLCDCKQFSRSRDSHASQLVSTKKGS